ncbi:hypothetical protein KI387_017034, partial [Taxus chinensis]
SWRDIPSLKKEKKGFKTKRPPVYRKLWKPKKLIESQQEADMDPNKEESKREISVDPALNSMSPNPVKLNMEVDEENEKVNISLSCMEEEEDKTSAHQELIKSRFVEKLKMKQENDKEDLESIACDLNQEKEDTDVEELTPIRDK